MHMAMTTNQIQPDLLAVMKAGDANRESLVDVIERVRRISAVISGPVPHGVGAAEPPGAGNSGGLIGRLRENFGAEAMAIVDLSNEIACIEVALGKPVGLGAETSAKADIAGYPANYARGFGG
jgi:hypothetical protein